MNGTFLSRHSISGLAGLSFAILCAMPVDAFAYIDPGSGSYLFQLGLAAVLAGLYTVRRQWYALVSAVRGRTDRASLSVPAQRSNDVE